MAETHKEELKNTSYELFILALSFLSLFNWLLYFAPIDIEIIEVVLAIDLLLSTIFMLDFLYRLATSKSRKQYFFRQYGWLDLLSSLPFPQAKIARLGRVFRAIRLMRVYGLRVLLSDFVNSRAGTAVYTVAFLIVLVLEFGSVAILSVEHSADGANILSAGDALWWSIVTVSTVGYGDRFPVTGSGRLIAIVVIIIGVGLFGVVTGFLADRFGEDDEEDQAIRWEAAIAAQQAAIIEEIANLRREQESASEAINARLDALFTLRQEDA